jgi:hypothetical protein
MTGGRTKRRLVMFLMSHGVLVWLPKTRGFTLRTVDRSSAVIFKA